MNASYIVTLADPKQLPTLIRDGFLKGYGQERIAFVGRSNVGKSTLLNNLAGSRIAHVSKMPGKTQAIHFFLWPEPKRILVDLPGYGFAVRSAAARDQWAQLIHAYFRADPRLLRVCLLLDSRRDPSEQDLHAMEFLKSEKLAITLILTKSDQLRTQKEKSAAQKRFRDFVRRYELEEPFFWINHQGEGIPELKKALVRGET